MFLILLGKVLSFDIELEISQGLTLIENLYPLIKFSFNLVMFRLFKVWYYRAIHDLLLHGFRIQILLVVLSED